MALAERLLGHHQHHALVRQTLLLILRNAGLPAVVSPLGLGRVATGCGQGTGRGRGTPRGRGGRAMGGHGAELTHGGSIGGRAGGRASKRLGLPRLRSCDAGTAAAWWVQLVARCLDLLADTTSCMFGAQMRVLLHSLSVTHIRNVRRVVSSVTAVLIPIQHSMVYRKTRHGCTY
jgi:hypothetical protein